MIQVPLYRLVLCLHGGLEHTVHHAVGAYMYRGTSLIRNCPPIGPYSRTMPRALWWS